MSASQGKPLFPLPTPAIKGPQLVRTEKKVGAQVPVEAIEKGGSHPLSPAFIIAGLALTGAFTFVGSIIMWLLFRDTGLNWMFQGISLVIVP